MAFSQNIITRAVEGGHVNKRTAQWFNFPFNFDPIWGPDECSYFDNESERLPYVNDPMFNLLALLR